MRLVIVESPFAARTYDMMNRNLEYARAALRDCLMRGEAPYASHLLYTQPGILRDEVETEREFGIAAGLEWGRRAAASVAYLDLGISRGMKFGIHAARAAGRPVEYRTIEAWW